MTNDDVLVAYLSSVEAKLTAAGATASHLGHPVNKGTAREILVREFLTSHLGETFGIGTGEIISSKSLIHEKRRQHDLIIYRRSYPKLQIAPDIDAFLAESVLATIEVKSTLTRTDLTNAVRVAHETKKLERAFWAPFKNLETNETMAKRALAQSAIVNYVFAFDGPVRMGTVYRWIRLAHDDLGIKYHAPPADGLRRFQHPSPSIDAIIILNRGVLWFDNTPISPANLKWRKEHPAHSWYILEKTKQNLLFLFLHLNHCMQFDQIDVFKAGDYLLGTYTGQIASGP